MELTDKCKHNRVLQLFAIGVYSEVPTLSLSLDAMPFLGEDFDPVSGKVLICLDCRAVINLQEDLSDVAVLKGFTLGDNWANENQSSFEEGNSFD